MEKQGRSSQPFFHEDFLFREIMPKVPTKSIVTFKSVSKSWLARIGNDSTFIADHTAHHQSTTASGERCKIIGVEIEYPDTISHKLYSIGRDSSNLVEVDMTCLLENLKKPVKAFYLIGCSNGLVCLMVCSSDETSLFVVWNPVTREFHCFPLPEADFVDDQRAGYYFGVEKGSTNYKVVCVEEAGIEDAELGVASDIEIRVQVFSKRSGSWRRLKGFSGFGFVEQGETGLGKALTLDGTMYWAIEYLNRVDESPFHILLFDLFTEKSEELVGPLGCLIGEGCVYEELIKWKGCLCAVMTNKNLREWKFCIKTKNGDSDINPDMCWTKMTITYPSLSPYDHIGFVGNRLILGNSGNCVLYDVMSHEISELEDDLGNNCVMFDGICSHIHSLQSPN